MSRRLSLVLIACAVSLAAAFYAVRTARQRPIGAYVIPLGEVAKVSWWAWPRVIETPTGVPGGAQIKVTEGSTVAVVFLDGTVQRVAGPARALIPAAPPKPVAVLGAPEAELKASAKEASAAFPAHHGLRVTSPVGVTRYLNPVISWVAKAGVLYDVALVDPADEAAPPRLLRGARPPVSLEALEGPQAPRLPADRIFAVLVRESVDREVVGINRFLTREDATLGAPPVAAAERVLEAVDAMKTAPARTGDAWLALQGLPPAWAASPLVARLRIVIDGQLGLGEAAPAGKSDTRRVPPSLTATRG